ncbi:MAG TPA: cyclic pyranopterin monophosphate synthase MoaC [Armatimonadota bacterium]|nr:cyclic pyranopterin monophosphate synthase MoaC [Armatimonadota bacterium]
MIDIHSKTPTDREAVAVGRVRMNPAAIKALAGNALPKGDALAAARIAGVMAAKRTPDLIPLCHPIPVSSVHLEFQVTEESGEIEITATTRAHASTGVEMEALTAVAVAALTIHDMCKGIDPAAEIITLHVVRKSGGKTGLWERKESS